MKLTNTEVCPEPGLLIDDECVSHLKTAMSGAYHNFSYAKYTDRYLAEVGF